MYRFDDLDYMREALRLAEEGIACTSPNPLVGAVVVQDGQIMGRGTHVYEGQTHAEVLALTEAGEAARGGTLYVNLEPCCHKGRTGPCTEAIIAAGIAKVVAGGDDPNPKVAGKGLKRLTAAGIKVETGCMGREARRLNEDFEKWIQTGLPFVTLKAAVSLDGRIGGRAPAAAENAEFDPNFDPKRAINNGGWISSATSRDRVQVMRHRADAILTGIGTALADNPLLTDRTRRPRRRPLLRVVLDSGLRLPLDSQLVTSAKRKQDLLVFHSRGSEERVTAMEAAGVALERLEEDEHGRPRLDAVLRRLGARDMLSVLVEAGAEVNGAMLRGGLCDKLILFQAPTLLGGTGVPLAAGPLEVRLPAGLATERIGPDTMIEAYLQSRE